MSEHLQMIPEGWLSLEEAMRQLDRSQRRLQEYVKAGVLKSKRIHVEGRNAPAVIYSAPEVETLRKRQLLSAPRPALVPDRKPKPKALPPPEPKAPVPAAPAAVGLFLTLEQASLYSGLTIIFLRKLIKQGKLFALRGGERGTWVISRASLENFAGRRRFR